MEESNCLSCAGKYRPGLDKVNPKRWKANFRCALNSLPDVKEVPSMSRKNGADGYMVCRLTTNATQNVPAKTDRRGRVDRRAVYQQQEKEAKIRQDAAASLQMIALDAHKRAYSIKQQHPMTSEDQTAPTQVNHCEHHLSNVQHEVIIDNTLTIQSIKQQQQHDQRLTSSEHNVDNDKSQQHDHVIRVQQHQPQHILCSTDDVN